MPNNEASDSSAFLRIGGEAIRFVTDKALYLLPASIKAPIEQFVDDLNEVFVQGRAPRIAVFGRAGAGKSALIAALAEGAEAPPHRHWTTLTTARGKLRVLEARLPGRASGEENGLPAKVAAALREEAPDLMLYCVAAEPDTRPTEKDRLALQAVGALVQEVHGYALPVLGILTHVDAYDTGGWQDAPFDEAETRARIDARVLAVATALGAGPRAAVAVEPVCLGPEYVQAGMLPWGMEDVIEGIVELLPRPAQLEMARLGRVEAVQRHLAKTLGRTTASLAAGVAATPLPFADLPLLTALQTAMIMAIGYVSGRRFSMRTILEFLSAMGVNVGVGFAARELARQVGKFIPIVGSAASAAVAYGTTVGLAYAAIAYFIEGRELDEARSIFRREKKRAEEDPAAKDV